MKTNQPVLTGSIVAAAALTRGLFIGFDGNVCAANAKAFGVCTADTAITQEAPVICSGIALVLSSAAISVGAAVGSTSAGKAVTVAALSATVPGSGTSVTSSSAQPAMTMAGGEVPVKINGYALDAASAADEYIRILIK